MSVGQTPDILKLEFDSAGKFIFEKTKSRQEFRNRSISSVKAMLSKSEFFTNFSTHFL